MAKTLHRLTAKNVENAKPGKALNDGGGLFFRPTSAQGGRWTFKFTSSDPAYVAAQVAKGSALRQREMGLGSFPGTGLASAREKAAAARALVAQGLDPIEEAAKEADAAMRAAQAAEIAASAMTFGRYAQDVYLPAVLPGFSNAAHIQQWETTFRVHTASLNPKRLRDVTRADVLAVIQPIWTTKNVTASRVRERIERLIAHAIQNGHFEGDNPAAWRQFDATLSRKRTMARGHHASIPHDELPDFIAKLREKQAVSLAAVMVEWIALSACRTGEARFAVWGEIDPTRNVWNIPAGRMKMKRDHSVPITPRMAELLEIARALHIDPPEATDLIFRGPRGRELSEMAGMMLLRRIGYGDFTVHGLRASFKGWAATETDFARELIEEQLAHQLGAVERAYMRTSAVERRRVMMEAWAAHMTGDSPAGGNVVPLGRAVAGAKT